ncbi:MAG TPA: ABC transporter permease [Chryseolinea sp.]
MNIRPPKLADKFLEWYCNPELLEEIQGDALELYYEHVKTNGKTIADCKYIWDVIRFCRWSNIQRSNDEFRPGYLGVLLNLNFKIELRNILRHKLVFTAKMAGLSICLAFAFAISAFVIHEVTFDDFHRGNERIFRVGSQVEIAGASTDYAVSPLALADGVVEEIEDVENACRVMYTGKPIFTIGEKVFTGDATLATSPDFFKIFTFDLIQGTTSALADPNKIILTESMARKFFGEADPLHKVIDLPWTQLEVAGVVKDVPSNSHLKFNALISWDTYDFYDGWDNLNAYTYVALKSGFSEKDFLARIRTLFQDHQADIEGDRQLAPGDKIRIAPIVENVRDIHLSEYRDEDIAEKRSGINVYILMVVAFLFFAMGLINFINLSLAEQTTNFRKMGILQIFGGSAADHEKVILTNLIITTLVIAPVTALLVYVSLTAASNYFSFQIGLEIFVSPQFLTVLGAFAAAFIFSSRINLFILSGSNDIINALRGKFNAHQSGFKLREFLVATQLAFSIVMIAIIVIIVEQFEFINSIDKGFEDKNTIVIKMRSHDFSDGEAFQESIRGISGVKKVDASSFYLDNIETKELFEVETSEGRKKMLVAYMNCGDDYLEALGIKILQGRNFSKDRSADKFGAYIVNETAAKAFGWEKPLGQRIWGPMGTDRDEGEVIGVIRDFNFASLHNKIEPLIIFPIAEGWGVEYVYVKADMLRPSSLISQIEAEYKKVYPEFPFEWEYLDSKYQSLYQDDYEIKRIFHVGLIISIFVSSLGIFSISAFLVIVRAKEMGIRKVIGAHPFHLFVLHMKRFVLFIVISVVVASPAIYYLAQQWLSNFAYRIELSLWYFVVPALITLAVVLMTAGYHGIKNARVNPVDILKYE